LEAILEDIEPYRATTLEQRVEIQAALCRLAVEQIDAHPRRREILDFQEPRSRESLVLWQRLRSPARGRA
jgi:hypothetical protein